MLSFEYPGPGTDVSYHNHSNWSDGTASLREVCKAGKAAGLRELGLSDHWVVPAIPNLDSVQWSMRLNRLAEYVSTLRQLKQELDDEQFTIRIGLEVDFFQENGAEVRAALNDFPLDYLIGSVHYAGDFPIDHDIADWRDLGQAKIDWIWETYWDKLLGAAASRYYQILGHIDLPKKFAFKPSRGQLGRAAEVLDAVRNNNMALELNTAGWEKPCREAYPSLAILKMACEREIPVVITADAHSPEHLTRHFGRARKLLLQAGYPPRRQ